VSPAARRISSKQLIKALERAGFTHVRTAGSHYKMRRNKTTVIVPLGRDPLPIGTQRAIMIQAGLTDADL
jgi:predicted RNA binding protein YcfA (HicA-like mRNA interferase family)